MMNNLLANNNDPANQAEAQLARVWQAAIAMASKNDAPEPAQPDIVSIARSLQALVDATEQQPCNNPLGQLNHGPSTGGHVQSSSAFQPLNVGGGSQIPEEPQQPPNPLESVNFWLQLYQISKSGLKGAIDDATRAIPALAPILAAMPGMPTAASLAPPPQVVPPPLPPPPPPPPVKSTAKMDAIGSIASLRSLLKAMNNQQQQRTAAAAAAAAPRHHSSGFGHGLVTQSLPLPALFQSQPVKFNAERSIEKSLDPDTVMGFGGKDWSLEPSDGPDGHYRKRMRRAPVEDSKICANCGTTSTPFWRKERHSNQPLCNACGLYAAKNDHPRPVKLWRDGQGNPGALNCKTHQPYSAPPSVPSIVPPQLPQGTVQGAAAGALSALAHVAAVAKNSEGQGAQQNGQLPKPTFVGPAIITRPSFTGTVEETAPPPTTTTTTLAAATTATLQDAPQQQQQQQPQVAHRSPSATLAEMPNTHGGAEQVVVQVQSSDHVHNTNEVAHAVAAALERAAVAIATAPAVISDEHVIGSGGSGTLPAIDPLGGTTTNDAADNDVDVSISPASETGMAAAAVAGAEGLHSTGAGGQGSTGEGQAMEEDDAGNGAEK